MAKKGFFNEFKEFAMRGNVIDLAVGVIIGASFQAIVNSLVKDIVMPLVGAMGGNMDFSKYAWQIGRASVAYGAFITAVLNFVIMAFVIFLFVRGINKLRNVNLPSSADDETAATVKKCPFCKSEIDIEAARCSHCTAWLDKEHSN